MKNLYKVSAYLRLIGLILTTAVHCIGIFIGGFVSSHLATTILRNWGRSVCFILGIKVDVKNQFYGQSGICIANHRSYADIPVLLSISPYCFLAKYEVRTWPLIGLGAKLAGCVFVNRENQASRTQSRQDLKQRIVEGRSVLIFAEGTTTAQTKLLPLKPGMFHEAKQSDIPIQLICLEYAEAEDAWTNQGTLEHFLSRFSRRRTYVFVSYKPALIIPAKQTVDTMVEQATDWLIQEMKELLAEKT